MACLSDHPNQPSISELLHAHRLGIWKRFKSCSQGTCMLATASIGQLSLFPRAFFRYCHFIGSSTGNYIGSYCQQPPEEPWFLSSASVNILDWCEYSHILDKMHLVQNVWNYPLYFFNLISCQGKWFHGPKFEQISSFGENSVTNFKIVLYIHDKAQPWQRDKESHQSDTLASKN